MRGGLVQRVPTEKTTQNGVLHINSAPIGDEPREEYHAGIVSRAVTKTSIAMPAESRKGGVIY